MKQLLRVFFISITLLQFLSCDSEFLDELSNEEIIQGLKQALEVGTDSTVLQLNATDGYLKNELIKILFPPEAKVIESTLNSVGLQSIVDEFVVKMNRSAEDAAKEAKPIFIDAITNMTITDGLNILEGTDSAATIYLRNQTYNSLYDLYAPKVENSMNTIGAHDAWETITTNYNNIPFTEDVETDISAYVTKKALDGLFKIIAEKEKDIRNDPTKRVTDLLKKVFGSQD